MPFLIPVIAGLVGMFAGAQVDRAVDNATTRTSAERPTAFEPIPWQIAIPLMVGLAAVLFFWAKKQFNK